MTLTNQSEGSALNAHNTRSRAVVASHNGFAIRAFASKDLTVPAQSAWPGGAAASPDLTTIMFWPHHCTGRFAR